MLELYKNIRKYRKQMGLTQEELQMRLTSSNIKGFIELLEQVLEQIRGAGVMPAPLSTRQQR